MLVGDSNAEAAGALMREHMDIQRRNFDDFLALISQNLLAAKAASKNR